jgi:pimeloyl-ACP methyl ester carboxylesterase
MGNLCGWWPYANYLAKRGFTTLSIDFRCFGLSACGSDPSDLVSDAVGAVEELKNRGFKRISIAGAGVGGTVAAIAGAMVPVTSVVSLSGAATDPDFALHAEPYLSKLKVPTLYVTTNEPGCACYQGTLALRRATAAKVKPLIVKPSDWGYGWALLNGGFLKTGWSSIAETVADFLRKNR